MASGNSRKFPSLAPSSVDCRARRDASHRRAHRAMSGAACGKGEKRGYSKDAENRLHTIKNRSTPRERMSQAASNPSAEDPKAIHAKLGHASKREIVLRAVICSQEWLWNEACRKAPSGGAEGAGHEADRASPAFPSTGDREAADARHPWIAGLAGRLGSRL
jgi:hypothetical protein